MSPHKSFLSHYKSFNTPKKITIGNGEHLQAKGEGSLHFRSGRFTGVLLEVLWVPDLSENLFSVPKAMEQNCDVKFDPKSSKVQFFRDNQLVLQGFKEKNFIYFLLNLQPLFNENSTLFGASLDQLHRKLSHCSKATIKQIIKNKQMVWIPQQRTTQGVNHVP